MALKYVIGFLTIVVLVKWAKRGFLILNNRVHEQTSSPLEKNSESVIQLMCVLT